MTASGPAFEAVPILRIFDLPRAKDFYLGFLGFTVDWENRTGESGPWYLQISRGGLVLHLSEHHGDGTPGSGVFVRTTELDAFHAEITSKGYPFMRPGIEEAPWGGRIMTVIDSFQSKLHFHEAPEESAPGD